MSLQRCIWRFGLVTFCVNELPSKYTLGDMACIIEFIWCSFWAEFVPNWFRYFLPCAVGKHFGNISAIDTATSRILKPCRYALAIVFTRCRSNLPIIWHAVFLFIAGDLSNESNWGDIRSPFSSGAFGDLVWLLSVCICGTGVALEGVHLASQVSRSSPPNIIVNFGIGDTDTCKNLLYPCIYDSGCNIYDIYAFPEEFILNSIYMKLIYLLLFCDVGGSVFNEKHTTEPESFISGMYELVFRPVKVCLLGWVLPVLWLSSIWRLQLINKMLIWPVLWWSDIGGLLLVDILVCFSSIYLLCCPDLHTASKRELHLYIKKFQKLSEQNNRFVLNTRHVATAIENENIKYPHLEIKGYFTKIWSHKVLGRGVQCKAFSLPGLGGLVVKDFCQVKFSQSGLAGLVSAVLGLGISGLVLRFYQPAARSVIRYNVFITLSITVGFILFSQIGCPKIEIFGPRNELATSKEVISSSSIMSASGHNLSCSSDCGCSDRFEPVCGQDGQVYYSPCYAGCTQLNVSLDQKIYSNCQCIINTTFNTEKANKFTSNPEYGTAKKGYCPTECFSLYLYIGGGIIAKMVMASGKVGSVLVFIRGVEERDKALALGLLTFFIAIFGFIPAPIIMGAVIDSTCLVWDWRCGARGNCWFYNTDSFRLLLHAVPGIFVFLSVFGDLLMLLYSDGIQMYGETDEDEKLKEKHDASELKPLKDVSTLT
ncbi:unnamed protein product, partial [Meganyctiphanes norvegica]